MKEREMSGLRSSNRSKREAEVKESLRKRQERSRERAAELARATREVNQKKRKEEAMAAFLSSQKRAQIKDQIRSRIFDSIEAAMPRNDVSLRSIADRLGVTEEMMQGMLEEITFRVRPYELDGRLYLPDFWADPIEDQAPESTPKERSLPRLKPGAAGAGLLRTARRLREGISGVYVIRCESSGRYKIGKSTNVRARLLTHARSLACERMPGPLVCLRIIDCSQRMLGWIEHAMHWIYDESRMTREEIFEGGIAPLPEALCTAEDVLALYREKAEALMAEESKS